MSQRTIYALLVGIDDYPIPSHKLNGCVNDVNAIHEFLDFRCKSENTELKVLKLLNHEATKDNIVRGFLEHLGTATNQDDAFFYFSGHGAQEVAPPEFWQVEPDKLNESMVCVDSRTASGGVGDLVDKEISYLLWKVSAKNPRILVVMDCCHSGSGTRSTTPSKLEYTTRQIPMANKMRKINEYLGFNEGFYQIRADGQVVMKRGNYVALAAARANEFAKETTLDGQKRGAFNYSLIETLKAAKGDLSYGDLMSKVKAKVISLVPEQNPQIEICVPTQIEGAVQLASLDNTFLGGLPPKEDFLRIYYRDDVKSWVVNMGQMQGLSKNTSPSDPNILSVFNFADASGNKEYKLITDENKGNDVARAIITKVEKDYSRIEFQDHPKRNPFSPDIHAIYKAKLTSSSIKPTLFYLEGSDEDTKYLRNMVETDGASQPYAKFTDNPAEAKYRVVVSQDQFTKKYEFLLNQDGKKVCKDVRGRQTVTPANAMQVGEGAQAQKAWSYVQTIAKWENTLAMSNPDTSFPDNAVVIEVIDAKEIEKKIEEQKTVDVSNGLNLLANQKYEDMMLTPDMYWRVKNNTGKQLYCTAIWMSQNFGADLTSEASLQIFNRSLPPHSSFDILDGSPVNLTVNENLLRGGEFQEKIVIKLIYSTEEFSPDFVKNMTLTPLPFPATPDEDSATRGLVRKASAADWSVFNLFFTVTQPPQPQKVLAGKPAGLLGKNSITSNFAGGVEVALASPQQQFATRDVNQKSKDFAIPQVFRENSQFQPISFNNADGDITDLSILEVRGIANLQKTDEGKPLFDLRLDAQAEEGDVIFPITFDGEFFLPIEASSEVNENGEVIVSVDNLPQEAAEPKIDPETQTRSLTGSVKIFFQKVVSKKLGREFQYPLLDMATDIKTDGFKYMRQIHSDKDYGFVLDKVAREIENKKNIAVFVHGIIGDTETMPQSLVLAKDDKGNPLLEKYDAVLTLDYENLNTPIEANSQFFKERLEHIGLKAGHDKNVHIYAHSMGGLVSRYMIENLRGDEIVNHLIMLGTPNAGSPFSALKDWIQMAISMAMSKIALFGWATAPMVFLFNKTMREIGVSLKQLNGNEPFLQNLAKTAQPKTPYTIIAGNTKLTPLLAEGTAENGALKRLLGKIQSKVLDDFLFGSPNDIAVSLDSIKSVKWVKQEEVIEVACDHMSYFTTEEGTKAIAEAASKAKFL